MPLLMCAGQFLCRVMPAQKYFGQVPSRGSLRELGTPYIGIPLEVIDGEWKNHHITAYLYLSDAAFDRTILTLAEVFNFNGNLDALYTGLISFEGLECSIVTEIEIYDGKERCKVRWLNKLGGGRSGINPMKQSEFESLLSKYGSRAQAIAKQTLDAARQEAPTAPVKKMTSETETKDDLPF